MLYEMSRQSACSRNVFQATVHGIVKVVFQVTEEVGDITNFSTSATVWRGGSIA